MNTELTLSMKEIILLLNHQMDNLSILYETYVSSGFSLDSVDDDELFDAVDTETDAQAWLEDTAEEIFETLNRVNIYNDLLNKLIERKLGESNE